MTSLRIGASPEEILCFLIKHRREYRVPSFRPGQTKEERRHLRLARVLSYLANSGTIEPGDTDIHCYQAVESLKASGIYRERRSARIPANPSSRVQLVLGQGLPNYRQHPKDYDPPPRRSVSVQEPAAI
jgi:hypothetical protein